MGLHGVVICFANRKADEFDSRILHQIQIYIITRYYIMFPLTETYKAVQNSDSNITSILVGISFVLVVVTVIIAVIWFLYDNHKNK